MEITDLTILNPSKYLENYFDFFTAYNQEGKIRKKLQNLAKDVSKYLKIERLSEEEDEEYEQWLEEVGQVEDLLAEIKVCKNMKAHAEANGVSSIFKYPTLQEIDAFKYMRGSWLASNLDDLKEKIRLSALDELTLTKKILAETNAHSKDMKYLEYFLEGDVRILSFDLLTLVTEVSYIDYASVLSWRIEALENPESEWDEEEDLIPEPEIIETIQKPIKIKFKGSAAVFGYLFHLMEQNGYIELPINGRKSSRKQLARLLLQSFEIDTTVEYLAKQFGENGSLSNDKRDLFKIPPISQIGK